MGHVSRKRRCEKIAAAKFGGHKEFANRSCEFRRLTCGHVSAYHFQPVRFGVDLHPQPRLQPPRRGQPPGHSRRIMRQPKPPIRPQQNNPSMPAQPVEQIRNSLPRRQLRRSPRRHPIRSPLPQHQLHNRLAPPRQAHRRCQIIRIAPAPNQRAIPHPPRRLIQRPARRSSRRQIPPPIQRHRPNSIVRPSCRIIPNPWLSWSLVPGPWSLFLPLRRILILPGISPEKVSSPNPLAALACSMRQPYPLPLQHQLRIVDQRHPMRRRKLLRARAHTK